MSTALFPEHPDPTVAPPTEKADATAPGRPSALPDRGSRSPARLAPHTLWRRIVFSRLRSLEGGQLWIHEQEHCEVFGSARAGEPIIHMRVLNPAFYGALLWRSDIGAGLSYSRGWWTCDDLTSLIQLFIRNTDRTASLQAGLFTRLHGWAQRLQHFLHRNTAAGSRRNIAAHYDLGNDFFASFLDPSLSYSCGIYRHPGTTLEEASAAKNERICRTLGLTSEDEVLEIGCGWGGFALHAASRHGCRVVAVTISPSQYQVARRRVLAAGLEDRIEVILEDYRNLPARLRRRFSKLVSIEMIEAVGHDYLETYFATCSKLLQPDGAMLLQGILIHDDLHAQYMASVDFIRACIFPGGSLPSLASVNQALARATDLRVADRHAITSHYPPTLMAWRRRLLAARESLLQRGYGDDLIRLWDFYFCYCAAGFQERRISVSQLLLTRPGQLADTTPAAS